jgi:hypothetical protein
MHYAIRLVAGTFVLISLALGYWVHPAWFLFTAFVGMNLVQSAFTRWCLMETILARLGLVKPDTVAGAPTAGAPDHPTGPTLSRATEGSK